MSVNDDLYMFVVVNSRIFSKTLSSEPFHVHATAHPSGAASFVHPAGTSQAVGVGVEQSKLVVGGVVVQAQGCGAGDGMMAYVAGSVPHSHQPGPSAIAAQVLSGSAAWTHETEAVPEAVVEGAGVAEEGVGLPVHEPRKSMQPW